MSITNSYKYLLHFGISPRHKGFCYLSMAVMAICFESEVFCAGAGDVYTLIQQRTDVSRSQAERCIRYAIEQAWADSDSRLHELFSDHEEPPKLPEFLCRVALYIDDSNKYEAQQAKQ